MTAQQLGITRAPVLAEQLQPVSEDRTVPKLTVKRPGEFLDIFRSYKIYVNGEKIGTIHRSSERSFDVPAGNLTIMAKIDWTSSNVWDGTLSESDTLTLVVSHEGSDILKGFGRAGDYLTLREEGARP